MKPTRKSPLQEKCCEPGKDFPDPIQKELDNQGGMEGLLSRIPDPTSTLRK